MVDTIDWKRVTEIWRKSGRAPGTIAAYAIWARRFVRHCMAKGRPPLECLTRAQVRAFVATEIRGRFFEQPPRVSIFLSAVRALWCALGVLGHHLPPWRSDKMRPRLPQLAQSFVEYRRRHHGVAPSTSPADARLTVAFIGWLRQRKRRVARIRVVDIDEFVTDLTQKWAPKTVAGVCSTLRAFLRYLHATGRISVDLAFCVIGPHIRQGDRPPRAMTWLEVRRILNAIDTHTHIGRRDYAMFLMMAAYGMGAGEVLSLRLDNIDWSAKTIRVCRPKTGTVTILPLLGPIGGALKRYLCSGRPPHAVDRTVFVSHRMPHAALSGSGAIRHRLAEYAAAADVSADFLGSHVFRHTHATRQIEGGASPKVVSDILGHSRPESTSAYVRGAILKLRPVSLPVPR